MSTETRPPRWASELLARLVSARDRDEILGDLLEAFSARVERHGATRARWWYLGQALRFLVRVHFERGLEVLGGILSSETLDELRGGRRVLRSAPWFSFVVILVLSLGIGANTAMFDVLRVTLIEPLPFADPDRLVLGRTTFGGNLNPWSSGPDYVSYRNEIEGLEGLAAIMPFGSNYTLTGFDRPERIMGVPVSVNFFQTLGVAPVAGRPFGAADGQAGAPRVVMITHEYWQARFGGSQDIVGSDIVLDGESHGVIGVTPPNVNVFGASDFWRPMRPDMDGVSERIYHNWLLVGRLAEGVSLTQARAQAAVVDDQLAEAYPESNAEKALLITPLHESLLEDHQRNLVILLGAVVLVLLIAAGNTTGMLLARAPARQAEMSVRMALGASRGRVMKQLIGESFWLAGIAGLIGVGLALALERIVFDLLALRLPGLDAPSVSVPMLAIAVGLAFATGAAATLYPALRSAGRELTEDLRSGRALDPSGARFRNVLVSAQVAVSVTLLIGSFLLIGSLRSAVAIDPGFDQDRLLTAELQLPAARYAGREEVSDFFTDLVRDISRIQGVVSVTAANNLPLRDPGNTYPFRTRSHDDWPTSFAYRSVTPGYFSALGIPLVRGRAFNDSDGPDAAQVAVLSERAARELFPDGDALGQVVIQDAFGEEREKEVVGIVGDVRLHDLETDPAPSLYAPVQQGASRRMRLAVRFNGDPTRLIAGIERVTGARDSDLPVADMILMDDVVADFLSGRRAAATALTLYAILPLVMALVGLYALLAYHVRQRSREIGVRLALGARPQELASSIVRRGMRLGAVGVAVGLGGGMVLSRAMRGVLFGIEHDDPAIFGFVATLILVLTMVAVALPARRATQVDPTVSLRA